MTGEEYAKKKRREQWRRYYERNRDKRLAYYREWRDKNREKVRAYHTAYMREYRKKNEKNYAQRFRSLGVYYAVQTGFSARFLHGDPFSTRFLPVEIAQFYSFLHTIFVLYDEFYRKTFFD